MKNLLLVLFTIATFSIVQGQESEKLSKYAGDEIGVSYNGSNFTLGYKILKKENKQLFIRSTFAGLSTDFSSLSNASFGIAVNMLKTHSMSDKFSISHGFGVGLAAQLSATDSNTRLALNPSINYRAEFNYKVADKMYVGASVNPNLGVNSVFNSEFENPQAILNLGLSNSASIHFFYQLM